MKRIRTGCKSIDDLFLGGIPRGILFGIYGLQMVGKTTLLFQMAINHAQETGERVKIIDTEGYWDEEIIRAHLSWYTKRWNIDESILEKVDIIQIPTVFKLARYYGFQLYFKQEEARIQVMPKYPRKGMPKDLSTIPATTLKGGYLTEEWFPKYSPLWKELQKEPYAFIAIDSITIPVKDVIAEVMQNLMARRALLDSFLSCSRLLAKEFNTTFIFTNHATKDPIFKTINPWGGADMIFYIKYWMGIFAPRLKKDDPLKKRYGDRLRIIERYRYPAHKRAEVVVLLEDDTGYIDLPPPKKSIRLS